MRKRVICGLLACWMAVFLCGCGAPKTETLDIFAMDTYMSLVAVGDGAAETLQKVSGEINALEQELSRTIESSDVARLNAEGSAALREDTAELLRAALRYSAETEGAFDVTIAPLVALWGITTDSPRVPSREEIDALLPLVGFQHVRVNSDDTAELDEGCAVDLGGIGKGYASDKAAELFAQSGISGGFVSLGGNVYVHGTTAGGKPWNVAIQDPGDTEKFACTLRLSDAFVVTSGGYQRNFTAPDGTVYQHIIDPATGYPVENGLLSVSIVTRRGTGSGTMADAYSTALYVMGVDGAVEFWNSHSGTFDMVLVTDQGQVLYTAGLANCFVETEGSGYAYECIGA